MQNESEINNDVYRSVDNGANSGVSRDINGNVNNDVSSSINSDLSNNVRNGVINSVNNGARNSISNGAINSVRNIVSNGVNYNTNTDTEESLIENTLEPWIKPSDPFDSFDTAQMYSPGKIRTDYLMNNNNGRATYNDRNGYGSTRNGGGSGNNGNRNGNGRNVYGDTYGNGYGNGNGDSNSDGRISGNNSDLGNFSQKQIKRGVKILRAVSLVLICVIASMLASYGILEYRIYRGDFDYPEVTESNSFSEISNIRDPEPETQISTVPVTTEAADLVTSEDIYQMALSQVVGIRTDIPSTDFFGRDNETTTPLSGSGFIISTNGYILTNYHVIELGHANDLSIIVSLHEGIEYDAEIVGYDPHNDVALVKIDATDLSPVKIGNSDYLRVGQKIYAIGNPFGDLIYTMTDGIVSGLDRIVTLDRSIINTFQLSAAVNSGNSGGPVYNSNGEVIGIVTAKLVRNSIEGIGFAIPINDAIEIAKELIEHGYISGRAFLGITPRTLSPEQADYYDSVLGCLVVSVVPETAADKAGMLAGDVITKIDDTEIISQESLRFALRDFSPGDTATLTVWRDGEIFEIIVTFDEDEQAGQPRR